MFRLSYFLFRFGLTYGLLLLLAIILLTVAYRPLKSHVLETRQITSLQAKSRILGYQTPDFRLLARDLLENHVFKPDELNNKANGTGYLFFYAKASELFPDEFEMFYMRGICQFWMGDLPSAEASLRKSLEINPVFFWSYYNLGLLYLKTGNIDAAIALFSRAQHIPPGLTKKFLHDLQAFEIIWRFMPDPENYINNQLQKAKQQTDAFVQTAFVLKDHAAAQAHADLDQWNPVFF